MATLQTLHVQQPLRAKAVTQYPKLRDLAEEDPQQGKLNSRLTVKSGRERIGGSDCKRIYIDWFKEAWFISPDKRRVKYDNLRQSQWEVQQNLFKYLASLHQDVCDYSFSLTLGSHALILPYLEEVRQLYAHTKSQI